MRFRLQVEGRSPEERRVVSEVTEAHVARAAQQGTNLSRDMIVVNDELHADLVTTDRASAALSTHQGGVVVVAEAVLPLPPDALR